MRALLLVMIGCGSPVPAPAISARPEKIAGVRECITQLPGRTSTRVDSVEIAGDQVAFCYGEEPTRSCWHLDVATKVFAPQPVSVPRTAPEASAKVQADGSVKLCTRAGACRSIQNPYAVPDAEVLGANDDLTIVAIGDGTTLRLFDTATGRERLTIPAYKDSPMYGDRFLASPTFATADRMIVWYAWTPVSEKGRVFDMKGRLLGQVGGADYSSIGPLVWKLHGSEYAVKGDGNDVVTVDVADPKITRTYDLNALLALPRPPADDDTGILDVDRVAGTAQRLIVVTAENPVTIGVIDRATNKLEKLEPPRCH